MCHHNDVTLEKVAFTFNLDWHQNEPYQYVLIAIKYKFFD